MLRKLVSGITLTLLLMCILTLTFNTQPVKIQRTRATTIYVDDDNTSGHWDGTPEHPYKNITNALEHASAGDIIYVYNGTYHENVVVNKTVWLVGQNREATIMDGSRVGNVAKVTVDNITITGFTIKNSGVWPTSGIALIQVENCSISGNNIINNGIGISLSLALNNRISGNNITNNGDGIGLFSSSNNSITENIITVNTWNGILLSYSSNNALRDNVMVGNKYNFAVYGGTELTYFMNDVDTSNTVDGKPIFYLINHQNLIIDSQSHPNIGYLAIVNSTNIIVQHLNMKNNGEGVLFAYTNNSSIRNMTFTDNARGIMLSHSSNNSLTGNNVTNSLDGISIFYSSSSNSIIGNNVTKNDDGIRFASSSNNTMTENNVTENNGYGIWLSSSSNNALIGNNIIDNGYGIWLSSSSNNKILHNNFMDNQENAFAGGSYSNLWDDGYPSGGNYWSDFKERYPNVKDVYSGSNQDQPKSDGFWDNPYIINENNKDRYPIVPEFPSFLFLLIFMMATLFAIIVYRKEHFQ